MLLPGDIVAFAGKVWVTEGGTVVRNPHVFYAHVASARDGRIMEDIALALRGGATTWNAKNEQLAIQMFMRVLKAPCRLQQHSNSDEQQQP